MASAAGATIVACSLEEGGELAPTQEFDAATIDATADTSIADSSVDADAGIFDAGATFCDLTVHDSGFFFCADFDDPAPTHGFTEVVTDGGTIAFVTSDASAPNLFEATLVNPLNDNNQNAYLNERFDFPDGGDAGLTFFSIAFNLRVNAILLDGSAPAVANANTFIVLLAPKYAIYAPIVGRPNVAPVSSFGTVDFNDASVIIGNIGDGGTALAEWNRFRFTVEVASDGGPSTLSAYENNVLVGTQVMSLASDVLTSRHLTLFLGPSANGPVNAQLDFDNVVIRSDKF